MMGERATLYLRLPVCLLLCVGLLVGPPPAAHAQRAAITLPRHLGQLVDQAATILRGYVLLARVEPHPELTNLYTVVVTLRVQETLKGSAEQTFTFRQYIWDIRDRYDTAGYRKGQHLLLLLNRPSEYGLSSPAGLEQGRFRILRDPQGNEVAVNAHGNAGLFRNLPAHLSQKGVQLSPRLSSLVAQQRAGPVSLDDLRELIRQLVGTN